jgi:STE24 endopeptidase
MEIENSTATIDLERQKKAKEYARIHRRLMLVDLGIGALYLGAWLGFGWAAGLKAALLPVSSNVWVLPLLYALVFGGIYLAITLPLSYYEEYVLPHRFDMSNQTTGGWIGDQVKGLAVSAVFGAIILEIIYALLRAAPETWWIWVSVILLVFSVLMANLAPVLLMPLFNKYTPLGAEHADLAERLVRLAERSHTRVQGVFKFDMSRRTKAANAALTGLGSTRRIILGDTLVSEFTPEEIETVLAHELGHQVNRDILLLIAFQSLTTVLGLFLASLGLRYGAAALGLGSPADVAALPLFILVMGVYGLITMPLGNIVTRWRERKADEYALAITGNGPAFASALTRLANQNLSEVDPAPWEEYLLYSHPALNRRIRMAQGQAASANEKG